MCPARSPSDCLFDIPEALEANSEVVHAAALVIGRLGLLLRGPSGSGKSTLQRHLRLEANCHDLFCRLVSDDYVCLGRIAPALAPNRPGPLIAFAPQATCGREEHYGLGILDSSHVIPQKAGLECPKPVLSRLVIDLVVDLVPSSQIDRMPEAAAMDCLCLGGKTRHLFVPARSALIASSLVFSALLQ